MTDIPRPDAFTGQRILITGGRGYLGASLSTALAAFDCEVLLLDRNEKSAWMPDQTPARFDHRKGDICQSSTWEDLPPNIDLVFHLASEELDRNNYDLQRDIRVNAHAVYLMLEAFRRKSPAVRIVFTSSANVFGIQDRIPTGEGERDNPPSLWSAHKLLAENYLRVYSIQFGLKSVVLRLPNLYGPTTRPAMFDRVVLNRVIGKAVQGENLVTYVNRNCLRDYLYLDDAVRALLLSAAFFDDLSKGAFCVLGSGERRTIQQVWQEIVNVVSHKTAFRPVLHHNDQIELAPLDRRDFVADFSRFHQITGWSPRVGLGPGIGLTVDHLLGKGSNHARQSSETT